MLNYNYLFQDDVGTVIECSGFIKGMMISRLIDRPCGVGFLDLSHYNKFLTCGVDDAREIVDHDTFISLDMEKYGNPRTPPIITLPETTNTIDDSLRSLPKTNDVSKTTYTEEIARKKLLKSTSQRPSDVTTSRYVDFLWKSPPFNNSFRIRSRYLQ